VQNYKSYKIVTGGNTIVRYAICCDLVLLNHHIQFTIYTNIRKARELISQV